MDVIPAFRNNYNLSLNFGPLDMEMSTLNSNSKPKFSHLKDCLRIWSPPDLTLIGRNIIVTTSALSELLFLFLVLPNPPDTCIKVLESLTCLIHFWQKIQTR